MSTHKHLHPATSPPPININNWEPHGVTCCPGVPGQARQPPTFWDGVSVFRFFPTIDLPALCRAPLHVQFTPW